MTVFPTIKPKLHLTIKVNVISNIIKQIPILCTGSTFDLIQSVQLLCLISFNCVSQCPQLKSLNSDCSFFFFFLQKSKLEEELSQFSLMVFFWKHESFLKDVQSLNLFRVHIVWLKTETCVLQISKISIKSWQIIYFL